MSTNISSIKIKNEIEAHNQHAIEVDVIMQDGSQRWCFFVTPEGIPNFGDFIDSDKDVRIHFGAAHMIVISKISEELIKKTIGHIENIGELERSTLKT